MKLKFDIHGYEIVIEETEENIITVSAMKDGEMVEEFELEGGEDHPGLDETEETEEMEINEPEEGQSLPEAEEEEITDEETIGEGKIENFLAFINKLK